MITFLKKILGIQARDEQIEELKRMVEEQQELSFITANRHYLASISLSDLDNAFDGMSESEKRDYLANASIVWNNPAFKAEIRRLIASQALFVASECANWEQSLVGRGSINGVALVEERFKQLQAMHLENITQNRGNQDEDIDLIPRV